MNVYHSIIEIVTNLYIFIIYDLQWLLRNQLNSFQRQNLIAFKLSLLTYKKKVKFQSTSMFFIIFLSTIYFKFLSRPLKAENNVSAKI